MRRGVPSGDLGHRYLLRRGMPCMRNRNKYLLRRGEPFPVIAYKVRTFIPYPQVLGRIFYKECLHKRLHYLFPILPNPLPASPHLPGRSPPPCPALPFPTSSQEVAYKSTFILLRVNGICLPRHLMPRSFPAARGWPPPAVRPLYPRCI